MRGCASDHSLGIRKERGDDSGDGLIVVIRKGVWGITGMNFHDGLKGGEMNGAHCGECVSDHLNALLCRGFFKT